MHEHSLQAVSMRGVIVYASSFEARKSVPSIADLGLYLDPVWETADLPSVYEILEWPDFGTPLNVPLAHGLIALGTVAAKLDHIVEIGCVGGHGRTGTMLACMAGFLGVKSPVNYIREVYCDRAVESARQLAFVSEFFDTYCKAGDSHGRNMG